MPRFKVIQTKKRKKPTRDEMKSAGKGVKGAAKAVKSVRFK